MMHIGIKRAIFLLLKQAPENNAMAYTAVKLSACGISRVNSPSNMNNVMIKLVFDFTFDLFIKKFFSNL
tara:strand:- start:301 stop:507 length:207 start_codon:yes stop_codon:yes gene_type:complete